MSAQACSTNARISRSSAGEVSRRLAARHWLTAAVQPARLKMNTIAGSSPARSRRSTTSMRLGVQCLARWWAAAYVCPRTGD
jgi:hypothetical protein